ncbi:cobalt-precorrin-5B (C(1))-methyltransferase CbiD [Geomesophilobacter sediminis]|uniref:Cobalt-precorrin-5B C(1)-methyltransferase n=1 Tax=Geomesophilobacter sediminis TaxID=2798584 RepID=A0A8J7J7R4_9BACT|nr:cobalt-precorrin-5B (C(1))-methyltransferase CbiD [Geomesophilobacter sediminis]MBJ6725426.1 cobalt-precorrin-5B (C(1))-methyltransferase [Geomesophilobacter sediminis]
MTDKNLRYGYTTGSCAAAAVKAACQMLRDQVPVHEVVLPLPCGQTARFAIQGQVIEGNRASCFVVKDAGDDPDITNGAEIHATATVDFFTKHRIILKGGVGIGKVTKPGLAVAVGEWAINPVPRRMIQEAVKEVFAVRCVPATLTLTISIPNGEELAKKTLNERLGIVGGLSILGTSGIVKPISTKAWTDTIDTSVDVALACGCRTVVLATGRSSELAAQNHFRDKEKLADESYVMMGDHFGYAAQSCAKKGVPRVVIAAQFAKLVKIACGHPQTHVTSSELDLEVLAGWLKEDPGTAHLAEKARGCNTARELLIASDYDRRLIEIVCGRAAMTAAALVPGLSVVVFLAGYHGEMLYCGTGAEFSR